jgi:hypothetical protein
MAVQIAAGKRTALRSDGTFQPVGIDSRGRTGDGFLRVEYRCSATLQPDGAPGMTAGALTARLVTRWRTRLSVALNRALAEVYLSAARKEDPRSCSAEDGRRAGVAGGRAPVVSALALEMVAASLPLPLPLCIVFLT